MKTQKLKTTAKTKETIKPQVNMSLEEATVFLKKMGEWETVWHLDRETVIKWANFLKEREKV